MDKEKLFEEFDEKFKCIKLDCDGQGNIPCQISEGEWEAEECEFHAKYLFPIKSFLSEKLDQARAEERERIREKLERIKLDMDVVMCDCGEPYKDSDPAKLIDTLLASLDKLTDK